MAMALCISVCVCAAYGHAKDLSESRTDDNDKTGQGKATLSWPALRILSGRCRVRTECDLKASPKLLNATSVSVSVFLLSLILSSTLTRPTFGTCNFGNFPLLLLCHL